MYCKCRSVEAGAVLSHPSPEERRRMGHPHLRHRKERPRLGAPPANHRWPHAKPQLSLNQCPFLNFKVTVNFRHMQLSPVSEMLHLYLESAYPHLWDRIERRRLGAPPGHRNSEV
jgi:hypothetical protein